MTKILIVDDSFFARKRFKKIFEQAGHEVVGIAKDGKQGLELFISEHPDIVMLDYLMADKNGEEVLKDIIKKDPKARVIMVSGSGDQTIEARALAAGAKKFISKAKSPSKLLEVIDQVMNA